MHKQLLFFQASFAGTGIPEMPRAPHLSGACVPVMAYGFSLCVFSLLKGLSALTESAFVQGCNVNYWISMALINRSKPLQKTHVFSHYTDNSCVKVLF